MDSGPQAARSTCWGTNRGSPSPGGPLLVEIVGVPRPRRSAFKSSIGARSRTPSLAPPPFQTARRTAERIEPIVLLLGDPHYGRERIVGRLAPPQVRRGDRGDVEFAVRELAL
jgi:hypothetical protein